MNFFSANTLLQYPSNCGEGAFSACMQFTIYERTAMSESSPCGEIFIYMPENATNDSTVSWQKEPGAALYAAEAASRGEYSASAMAAIGGYAYKQAANKAASIGVPDGFTGTMQAGLTHSIPNPYLSMLFSGVDLRSFTFQFKLFPHSEQECDNIHKIITAFRSAAYPTYQLGHTTLGYPKEFGIQYIFNKSTNKWLNKFKRSVLEKVNVNYTGSGGWTLTRNGFPSEIVLELSFTEMQILVQEDINEKGY